MALTASTYRISRCSSRSLFRRIALLSPLTLVVFLTGCLSQKMYIDPALPKVEYAELVSTGEKHSVQVFFEFQSKGSLNANATQQLKPRVLADIKKSGLFTSVSEAADPTNAGYKLFITINNVPVDKNAVSKGVGTGLTFGLVGTMVTDGYTCKASYQRPEIAPIEKNYTHAIYTTIGNADGPKGLPPLKPQEAVFQMVDGFTLNILNDLRKDSAL